MGAVGVAVEDDGATGQAALVSCALDMPQPDLPAACAKHGTAQGRFGQAAPQLKANHVCLAEVPAVVTNSPPLVVVDHLDPARTLVVSIYQPDPAYRSAISYLQHGRSSNGHISQIPDLPKALTPFHRTPKRDVKDGVIRGKTDFICPTKSVNKLKFYAIRDVTLPKTDNCIKLTQIT